MEDLCIKDRAPLVTARIVGGLGNQMFIYAAAKALANRLSARLRLDVGGLQNDSLRSFALNVFNIPECCYVENKWVNKLRYLVAQYLPTSLPLSFYPVLLATKSFEVDPRFFEVKGSCFLYGYWQSYKYFAEYADEIRRVFSLTPFLTSIMGGLVEEMRACHSVSVHCRRGDYANNPSVQAVHGLCGMDYYERARGLIERMMPDAKFYIFSDDAEFAHEGFSHWGNVEFVDGGTQEEDMALMNACKHHIIANSSFSWWAAWLDASSDAVVIAPRDWFSRETMRKTYVLDLFPPEWVLL